MKKLILLSVITLIVSSCMNLIPMIAPTVEYEENIGEQFNFESRYINVLGSKIHYIDEGSLNEQGSVFVLVHGNPTSSYLWRNIIPNISKNNRVIALDLIGMGKSDKPKLDYTLQDHIRYFDQFIKNMQLKKVVLVLHDWGGAIGLNYYANHSDNVDGIVIMEAVIKPNYWVNVDFIGKYIFSNLRDDERGHQLIVEENYFIEKLMPMMSGRKLTPVEIANYNAPYPDEASRVLVSMWPKEIPIDEVPMRNHILVGNNYEYLKKSHKPILFLYGEPGMIFNEQFREELRVDFPNSKMTSVGPGMHYLQETQPTNISNLLLKFVAAS